MKRNLLATLIALAFATPALAGGGERDLPEYGKHYDEPYFNQNEAKALERLEMEEKERYEPAPTPTPPEHPDRDHGGGNGGDNRSRGEHDPTQHDHPDRPDHR